MGGASRGRVRGGRGGRSRLATARISPEEEPLEEEESASVDACVRSTPASEETPASENGLEPPAVPAGASRLPGVLPDPAATLAIAEQPLHERERELVRRHRGIIDRGPAYVPATFLICRRLCLPPILGW